MAMNPEIKAEWVKALRSGEYKQGQFALRDEADEHCCLGVLCELAVKAGVTPEPTLLASSYEYECESGLPPKSVQDWAGLIDLPDHHGPVIDELISFNDDGRDFAYIADVIEARL